MGIIADAQGMEGPPESTQTPTPTPNEPKGTTVRFQASVKELKSRAESGQVIADPLAQVKISDPNGTVITTEQLYLDLVSGKLKPNQLIRPLDPTGEYGKRQFAWAYLKKVPWVPRKSTRASPPVQLVLDKINQSFSSPSHDQDASRWLANNSVRNLESLAKALSPHLILMVNGDKLTPISGYNLGVWTRGLSGHVNPSGNLSYIQLSRSEFAKRLLALAPDKLAVYEKDYGNLLYPAKYRGGSAPNPNPPAVVFDTRALLSKLGVPVEQIDQQLQAEREKYPFSYDQTKRNQAAQELLAQLLEEEVNPNLWTHGNGGVIQPAVPLTHKQMYQGSAPLLAYLKDSVKKGEDKKAIAQKVLHLIAHTNLTETRRVALMLENVFGIASKDAAGLLNVSPIPQRMRDAADIAEAYAASQ